MFVIDSPLLLAEAVASAVELVEVFCEVGSADVGSAGVDVADAPVWTVADGVLSNVGSVVTSQGVAAIAKIPDVLPVSAMSVRSCDFVVELAAVANPANAGTIVRSAVAAGAQAVVFGTNSVDPWNPKTLRASSGALFKVPVLEQPALDYSPSILRDRVEQRDVAVLEQPALDYSTLGLQRFGADPHKGEPCDEVDFTVPLTLVLGNEAHGLDNQTSNSINCWVSVPTTSLVESLNVASAAAVLCYEVARQRRAVQAVR